ncbi:hypothetical protein DXG01_001499 [Tephrocybe rancida]|nr:hypothetical protein DXG01_001499 [Tephrocybe rancida]
MNSEVVCRPILVGQTLKLRHSVLWPDKPISHVSLPEDDHGLHIGAFLPDFDEPVAVISFFVEPLPLNIATRDPDSQHQVRFRKFACDPSLQGRGIGTTLLQFSFERVQSQLDATVVWCDARTSTADWYTKRGMTSLGETFFKGPVEYVRMYIDLTLCAGDHAGTDM